MASEQLLACGLSPGPPAPRPQTTTYGNGVTETRAYAAGENLIASISAPGVTGFTYAYDANDNRTSEANGTNNPWSWTTGAGGYDAADRLVGWTRTNGDSRAWDLSLVGDWRRTTFDGDVRDREHNAVHELTLVGPDDIWHDANGNQAGGINRGSYAYEWDVENRLATADMDGIGDSDPAAVFTFAYDALGRRVTKASTTAATAYVSAGPREVAEYAVGAAPSGPQRRYVFGDYVDEVLASVVGATRYYHHQDALYSTRALTGASGAVVERVAYDPYGKAILLDAAGIALASQTPTSTQILFTGRRLDPESGLQYSRARYYDSTLGRWTGRDPIGFADGFNLYQYVASQPLLVGDPSGEKSKPCPKGEVSVAKKLTEPLKPNGCGADDWIGKHLVPDQITVVRRWNFTTPCNNHDNCYGTCNSKKADCDNNFLDDLHAWCQLSIVTDTPYKSWFTMYQEEKELSRCYAAALIYYNAVKKFGEGPHSAAQEEACDCVPCPASTQPSTKP